MPTEACCFASNECQDLLHDDCINAGGQPIGEGTHCGNYTGPTGPGIGNCLRDACCRDYLGELVCDDVDFQICTAGLGGSFIGHNIKCRHVLAAGGCTSDPGPHPDCCMLDGTRLSWVPSQYCEATGGVSRYPSEDCPVPEVDEQCRLPQPDEAAGPRWTLELCARTAMLPRIASPFLDWHRAGYGMLLTARGVRNQPAGECRPAASTVLLDGRRYGSAVLCSDQLRFPGGRAHEGAAVIQSAQAAVPVTRPGYGYFVGAYDAPDWTEANLGSMRLRCRGIPL